MGRARRGRAGVFPLLALANLAVLVGGLHAAGVTINLSESQPLGLYREVREDWHRADLVEACLPAAYVPIALARGYVAEGGACGTHTPLIKRVAATGGDRVEVSARVSVNGRTIPGTELRARDSAGRALEPAAGGTLAADEIWLVSTVVPTSIDSRYFGAVPVRNIRHRLEALWTL